MIPRTHSPLDLERFSKSDQVRKSCFLCGKLVDEDTKYDREHVIPRLLVRPDMLEEPLILTAHTKCNQAKAFDEEYVAPTLQATGPDSSEHALRSFQHTITNGRRKLGKVLHADGKPHNKPGAGLLVSMSRKVESVNMFSKAGIYLGEYGKLPIEADRFSEFYKNIAKGYYVAASGISFDWEDYKIKVIFGMHSYDTTIPDDVFLFPFQHPTHLDSWEEIFGICGHVGKNSSGRPYSMWSISIFNEHKAVVMFTHNDIPIPTPRLA